MRRKIQWFLVMVVLMSLMSCATLGLKSWSSYTPKEKGLAMLSAYNAEFRDTMALALTPNLTEMEKSTVRIKKAVLKEAWPLIDLYTSTVEKGGVPSRGDEDKILALLNRIGRKVR